MRKRKIAALVGVAVVLLALVAESGVRLSGVTDVPLYRGDPAYGYVPQADQRGAWINKNRWVHNHLSMASYDEFSPGGVLLIGDSIVSGGNQMDHAQRLGPQISARIGETVWPISAGSWAFLNELAWLRRNPEVTRNVDRFVIVLNRGDFEEPSIYGGDPEHPDHMPISRVYYLADRLFLAKYKTWPGKPSTGRDWRKEFAAFRATTNKPVLVVLVPTSPSDAVQFQWPDGFGVETLNAGEDRRWAKASYRDLFHLDPSGTKLLATLVAERLRQDGV